VKRLTNSKNSYLSFRFEDEFNSKESGQKIILCKRALFKIFVDSRSLYVKLILKILSDLEPLRESSNKKTLYSTRSCDNWAFLALVGL
jgi:hypothetical protein